jgi:hypothetical protein
MRRDAWFHVLIGSKRQEVAKGMEDDPKEVTDDQADEGNGRLPAEDRVKVMIDLRS